MRSNKPAPEQYLIRGPVILAYPHFFTPVAAGTTGDSTLKYEGTFLIPKPLEGLVQADVNAIWLACRRAITELYPQHVVKDFFTIYERENGDRLKLPFEDGNGSNYAEKPEYHGHVVFKARSQYAPALQISRDDKWHVVPEDETRHSYEQQYFYGGRLAGVAVEVAGYDVGANKGATARLKAVSSYAGGTRIPNLNAGAGRGLRALKTMQESMGHIGHASSVDPNAGAGVPSV